MGINQLLIENRNCGLQS